MIEQPDREKPNGGRAEDDIALDALVARNALAVAAVTKPRLEDAIYYGTSSGRFDASQPNEANTPKSDTPNWVAASTSKLTFEAYQEGTALTAIYPHKIPDDLAGIVYCALGLAGEAGEIANKVKKLLRDGDGGLKRRQIAYECGDVLWYIPRL